MMTASAHPRWTVHLGVHKTATTHLQDTLAAHRAALVGCGVDYLPRDVVRLPLSTVLARHRWQYWTGGRPLSRLLLGTLAPIRSEAATTVVSEENILGEVYHALHVSPYPQLPLRLRALRALAEADGGVALFLSIRNFSNFWPSAYVEAMRIRSMPRAGFDVLRQRASRRPPRWRDVVLRIERWAPGLPLRLWRYEEYRQHWRSIVGTVARCDPATLPNIDDPRKTISPSMTAIEAVEALDPKLPNRQWRRQVAALFSANPSMGPSDRFAPFSSNETSRLDDVYCEDIAWIRQHRPGMLLEFSPDATST